MSFSKMISDFFVGFNRIRELAPGVDASDAVNKAQLDAVGVKVAIPNNQIAYGNGTGLASGANLMRLAKYDGLRYGTNRAEIGSGIFTAPKTTTNILIDLDCTIAGNQMTTVRIYGYNYSLQNFVDATIVFYTYNNAWHSGSLHNKGNYTLNAITVLKSAANKLSFSFPHNVYVPNINIDVLPNWAINNVENQVLNIADSLTLVPSGYTQIASLSSTHHLQKNVGLADFVGSDAGGQAIANTWANAVSAAAGNLLSIVGGKLFAALARPQGEIVFGSGAGVTSSPNFVHDTPAKAINFYGLSFLRAGSFGYNGGSYLHNSICAKERKVFCDVSQNIGSSFAGRVNDFYFPNSFAISTPNAANNEFINNIVYTENEKIGIGRGTALASLFRNVTLFGTIRFHDYNSAANQAVSNAIFYLVGNQSGDIGTAELPKTYTAGNATTITPANAIDIGGTMSADIAIAANTKKFGIIDGVFEAINNKVRILANNIRARMSVLDATGKAITDIYVQASEAMMMGTNNAKAAFMGISLNANPLQPEIIINTPDTATAIAGSVLTLQDPAYGTARWVAPQVKTLLWTITRGANGNVMGTGGIAPLGKLAILSAEISSGVVGYQNTFYPVTSWRFGNSLDCIVLPSNGQDSIYFTSQTSLNTNPSTIGTFPTGTDFQVRVNYIILP